MNEIFFLNSRFYLSKTELVDLAQSRRVWALRTPYTRENNECFGFWNSQNFIQNLLVS